MILENNPRCPFQVGDIVSRTGSDEHVVLETNVLGDLILVECIKADKLGIYKLGEKEDNCTRRYDLVRRKA